MSAEVDTFECIKNKMQAPKQVGPVKVDLFTHITEIINKIIAHHKYDAYQKFEEISLLIKKTQLNVKNPKTPEQIRQLDSEGVCKELDQYVSDVRTLLNEKITMPKVDKKSTVTRPHCAIGDFLENIKLLEFAGISFGEEETYKIYKSVLRLGKLTGAKSLRFWGKMLATKSDYYIVEGELTQVEELNIPKNNEPRGKGTNSYVYWVTDNILEDWIQLPDVSPEHIVAAKKFKKILTGNLNASVHTCPPFPGKERHLLRAQIARISHATTLFPKGLLEVNEEQEGQLVYTEDFTLPALAELNSTEAWGHQYANILNAGRVTHRKPDDIPEEEADELMAKLEEEDKVLDRLMGINEDAPIAPLETAWLLKIVGDDQPYNAADGDETLIYAANVLKSLRWPGALTVSYDGRFTNIYVGYGLKHGGVSYNPTSPPDVMRDPDEKVEQPEPTPLEAPEEPLEPDTDEDKKGEGENQDD